MQFPAKSTNAAVTPGLCCTCELHSTEWLLETMPFSSKTMRFANGINAVRSPIHIAFPCHPHLPGSTQVLSVQQFANGIPRGFRSRYAIQNAIQDHLQGLQSRRTSARAVNSIMTATYWEIGRRIVELDQGGTTKAEYGAEVVKRLSSDLTSRFGRGVSKRNVEQMPRFSLAWPIAQTLSAQSTGGPIPQTASGESSAATIQTPSEKSPTLSAKLQIVAGEAVAHYSLEGLPNKVMASEYKLALPEEKLLEEELDRTKRAIETQASSNDK